MATLPRPRPVPQIARPRPVPRPVAVAAAEAVPTGEVDIHKRLVWEYVDINDIVPYEFNARHNETAIPAVAESIKSFGFNIPVVIDINNVLVAGHTRVEAAKLLHMTEVPALRADHLTENQLKQFRLIDNKVASIATWNIDLLSQEMSALSDSGIDFTQFGWNQDEIDCLSGVVAADCLAASESAQAAAATQGTSERRAPITARFVLGEVVFFLPAAQYRNWVDGLRQLHSFNEVAIADDIKRRLGILQ